MKSYKVFNKTTGNYLGECTEESKAEFEKQPGLYKYRFEENKPAPTPKGVKKAAKEEPTIEK